MSFDLGGLRAAVAAHGRVARVVVAEVKGSAPREAGAAMLVWAEGRGIGQSGTIGGGALELAAAREALTRAGLRRHALGPDLGQCCGGAVTLLTEWYDAAAVHGLDGQDVVARGPGARPLGVQRLLDRARARGERPAPQLVQGWMVEPVSQARHDLWVWGAGHVGRAIVDVMAPVPDWGLTWVDTGPDRFPERRPEGVRVLPTADPATLVPHAPAQAAHLVLTYSHDIDFALCHAMLARGFAFAGLIGSDTKWARFRKRLAALGHATAQVDRICCPIGQKTLGKHPQAIAIGVCAQILRLEPGNSLQWTTSSLACGA